MDYLNVLSKKQLIEYLKTKSFQLSRVISEQDMYFFLYNNLTEEALAILQKPKRSYQDYLQNYKEYLKKDKQAEKALQKSKVRG